MQEICIEIQIHWNPKFALKSIEILHNSSIHFKI